jgi:16S rRNA G966 N2-methylase RsmD
VGARGAGRGFGTPDNSVVSDCCTPKGYRWIFSERNARGDAKRYRRKGLDPTSRRIVDFVRGQGVENRTVLEVGGGIGAIQIELLKAGAAQATSIELTPTYEEVAAGLAKEAGFAGRIDRRVMDFADAAGELEAADIVIMNRVICCYPDMPRLAGAAADRTRELLVMSYPRETWWTRIAWKLGNWALRLTRREFQVFLHPPNGILATTERHGLRTVLNQTGSFWTVAALRRSA